MPSRAGASAPVLLKMNFVTRRPALVAAVVYAATVAVACALGGRPGSVVLIMAPILLLLHSCLVFFVARNLLPFCVDAVGCTGLAVVQTVRHMGLIKLVPTLLLVAGCGGLIFYARAQMGEELKGNDARQETRRASLQIRCLAAAQ